MGYDPVLYALVHTGSPGDEAFYQRVCEGTAAVLELGSGYGRILRAIAAPGRQVVGLELDPGFRRLAQAELENLPPGLEVEVRDGDMRTFDLGRTFDRILIPHSGIYCLLSERDVLDCLIRVRRHLAPGGELVFDAYLADEFHTHGSDDALDRGRIELTTVVHDGVTYRVSESSTWDSASQRIDAHYFHVPEGRPIPPAEGQVPGDGRGVEQTGTIPQRYLLSGQVPSLLAEAGLELLAMAGDFDGRPVDDPEADTLVVIAGRATPDRPS